MANLRIDMEGKDCLDLSKELATHLCKTRIVKVGIPPQDENNKSSLDFLSISEEAMKRVIDESRKWAATKNRTFQESDGELERLTLEGSKTETFHIVTISD